MESLIPSMVEFSAMERKKMQPEQPRLADSVRTLYLESAYRAPSSRLMFAQRVHSTIAMTITTIVRSKDSLRRDRGLERLIVLGEYFVRAWPLVDEIMRVTTRGRFLSEQPFFPRLITGRLACRIVSQLGICDS